LLLLPLSSLASAFFRPSARQLWQHRRRSLLLLQPPNRVSNTQRASLLLSFSPFSASRYKTYSTHCCIVHHDDLMPWRTHYKYRGPSRAYQSIMLLRSSVVSHLSVCNELGYKKTDSSESKEAVKSTVYTKNCAILCCCWLFAQYSPEDSQAL
jgi:hypothetical protein